MIFIVSAFTGVRSVNASTPLISSIFSMMPMRIDRPILLMIGDFAKLMMNFRKPRSIMASHSCSIRSAPRLLI